MLQPSPFAKPECDNVLQPSPFAKPECDNELQPSPFAKPECDNVLQPSLFAKPKCDNVLQTTRAWQMLIHEKECYIIIVRFFPCQQKHLQNTVPNNFIQLYAEISTIASCP